MSFPRYPEYKDSGVEWLGEVPGHWDVLPCRSIVHERTAKNEGAACTEYLSLMANVGVIPYAEKGDVGNKKPEDVSKCKIVTRGDFVINSMNYGIGSYGLSNYDGVCSSVYIVLKPQNDLVESRFAFRIFENRSFQTFAQSFGNGILEHRCAINWDILKPIGVGVPPIAEQKAILMFLDRETAKIDELVREQRRLMELLKEKRQAVISHAVTQGLNPHAPMKPSGIEWLGEVPEHWEVLPLKKSFHIVGGSTPKSETESFWDGGILWATPSDLSKRESIYMNDTQRKITASGLASCGTTLVPSASIILSTRAPIGSLAIAGVEMCTNQGCKSLVPSRRAKTEYFAHLLSISTTELNIRGKGTTFLELSGDELGAFKTPGPAPPPPEQTQIAAFLDSELAKFDTLTAEAQRAIDLLQERRTALISAAVTGQIDVRLFVEREAA